MVPARELWRWRLVLSEDMSSLGRLRDAQSKQLNIGLDASGSATFTLNLDDPLSPFVENVATAVVAARWSPAVGDYVDRWSGPVWTVDEQLEQWKMSVSCVGWFEQLAHRFLGLQWAPQISYPGPLVGGIYQGVDRVNIAIDLISKINTQTYTSPQYTGTAPTYLQPQGMPYPITINAVRTYQDGIQIAQEVDALSQVEDGFDWWIDPVTRQMNFYGYRGQTRPDCSFRFGAFPGDNLLSCQHTIDSSTLCNYITAVGKYGNATASDPFSINTYGMFEDWVSLSDVVDSNILNAYAEAEIAVRSRPREIWNIVPESSDNAGVPVLFDDYDIGDTVFLTAKRKPRIDVDNQALRIFSVALGIDDASGAEKITQVQTNLGT